jgi:hypothetical protein
MRCLLGSVLFLCACGSSGSYELHWTVGHSSPESAKSCSSVGLDMVEVIPRNEPGQRSLFACYAAGSGALGHGPSLPPGETSLEVYGLSPDGERIAGPVSVQALIPNAGFVRVDVDLASPPACRDGVDNDGDGQVDLFDPECKDGSGTSE